MSAGRPSKYERDFHPAEFIKESSEGKSLVEIARNWEVDSETIYNWGKKHPEFLGAIKKGREYCEAWYSQRGRDAVFNKTDINVGMFVWMTKNICKWTDKMENNISADSTKGQIVVQLPPKKSKSK